MAETRAEHPVAPADLDAIGALARRAEAAALHGPLGEAAWRDLESGGQPGSAGVYATTAETLIGYAHVAPGDTSAARQWESTYAIDPTADRGRVVPELLEGVVAHVGTAGGGTLVLWVVGPDEIDNEAALGRGFHPTRELLQMRVALPLDETPVWPPGIDVRPFVIGQDETAWLGVNNRAFADHPEQGGWVEATLERRKQDPWFDPGGFLLAWDDAGLAGFCWTKIHPDGSDAAGLGEIFVIGVDPDRQGTGLGRALVAGGLASLAARDVTEGLLYVDGDNAAAVGLYRALGFTVYRQDRAYERTVG